MKWLQSIVREIFGLFVDDGSFAIMILGWVAVVTLLFTSRGWLLQWRGVILFCGLSLILLTSVLRYARSKHR